MYTSQAAKRRIRTEDVGTARKPPRINGSTGGPDEVTESKVILLEN